MEFSVDLHDISNNNHQHTRESAWWSSSAKTIEKFRPPAHVDFKVDFGLFELAVPSVNMGAISSFDLFGLDEMILFSFYAANVQTYKRVADLGANIGVHSLILVKLGFQVDSYEPDPEHTAVAERLLGQLDESHTPNWHQVAVVANSNEQSRVEFVRVKGNTTSSHVKGAKASPYGELEIFSVETTSFPKIFMEVDLIKMDVEGLEADLLESITSLENSKCDIILEVGSSENALRVFDLCLKLGFNMFAQKINWRRVLDPSDIPTSYKEGSLFLSGSDQMPWAGEAFPS